MISTFRLTRFLRTLLPYTVPEYQRRLIIRKINVAKRTEHYSPSQFCAKPSLLPCHAMARTASDAWDFMRSANSRDYSPHKTLNGYWQFMGASIMVSSKGRLTNGATRGRVRKHRQQSHRFCFGFESTGGQPVEDGEGVHQKLSGVGSYCAKLPFSISPTYVRLCSPSAGLSLHP